MEYSGKQRIHFISIHSLYSILAGKRNKESKDQRFVSDKNTTRRKDIKTMFRTVSSDEERKQSPKQNLSAMNLSQYPYLAKSDFSACSAKFTK